MTSSKKEKITKRVSKKYQDVKKSSELTPIISGIGIGVISGVLSNVLNIKIGMESWKNISVVLPLSICGVSVAGAVISGKKGGIFWASLAITSGFFAWWNWRNVQETLKLKVAELQNFKSNLKQKPNGQPQLKKADMMTELKKNPAGFRHGNFNDRMINGEFSEGRADSDQRTFDDRDRYPEGRTPFRAERPVKTTISSLSNPRRLVENVDMIP